MPVILYREQRKHFIGGVEQTGLWQAGQKVWAKPVASATPWSFLSNIAGQSGYVINERTADRLVFTRSTVVRSHLIFDWNLPSNTRLRFRYSKVGPALLWCRTTPDTSGTNVAREILSASGDASVDVTLNTRPYMGFLTGGSEPAGPTTYTIDQLIVNLP